jgi:uncharacterized membrane protein
VERRGVQWQPARAQQQGADTGDGLARALGWFSIALGVAEMVAPDGIAEIAGIPERSANPALVRGYGLREITNGIGILSQPNEARWVWARVAGDALDIATLGAALRDDRTRRDRGMLALAGLIGITALDVVCARRLSAADGGAMAGQRRGGIDVRQAITINRAPEEVYNFWRDFRNLPRCMSHLQAVTVIDDRRSHWVASAPAGSTVEWDAEIVEDRPVELIAWRSLAGAEVPNEGSVRFRPAPNGWSTEILVQLSYEPPAGPLGRVVAKLFGEAPEQQVKGDLRRLKQVLETGEVVHSDSSIHEGMYPAQPSA